MRRVACSRAAPLRGAGAGRGRSVVAAFRFNVSASRTSIARLTIAAGSRPTCERPRRSCSERSLSWVASSIVISILYRRGDSAVIGLAAGRGDAAGDWTANNPIPAAGVEGDCIASAEADRITSAVAGDEAIVESPEEMAAQPACATSITVLGSARTLDASSGRGASSATSRSISRELLCLARCRTFEGGATTTALSTGWTNSYTPERTWSAQLTSVGARLCIRQERLPLLLYNTIGNLGLDYR
jgi:hypothetical protein